MFQIVFPKRSICCYNTYFRKFVNMASTRAFYALHRKYSVTPNAPNIYLLCSFKLRLHNVTKKMCYSTKDSKKSMVKSESKVTENKVQVNLAEVVKENTKSAGYLAVIIAGFGVTMFICYEIIKELFSKNSPHGIYSIAFDRCINNEKVVDALGAPIKAYGEESRRGRRQHTRHSVFIKDNIEHMRMQFYIQGTRRQGTVLLEVQKNESNNYEFRYLYVKVNDVVGTVIKLEDNRKKAEVFNAYATGSEVEFN